MRSRNYSHFLELGTMLCEILQQVWPEIDQEEFLKVFSRLQACQLDNSPYHILGLDPSAPDEVVKMVYRHMAKRLHPDMPGGNAEAMTRLNQAYEDIARQRNWKP